MSDLTTIRVSSLPRGVACPGSLRPCADGTVPVAPSNEASALGSAAHEVLAQIVNLDLDHVPPIEKIAQRWGVDPDDVQRMGAIGLNRWRSLRARGLFPDPEAEWSRSMTVADVKITGHIDVLDLIVTMDDAVVSIADFKSGRRDNNHFDQIAGYALLALDMYADAKKIAGLVVWLLDDEIESIPLTRADVERWRDEVLIGRVINWDGVYHPGPQCEHCPRFAGCPARAAMVRSAVAELATEDQVRDATTDLIERAREGDMVAAEKIIGTYERARLLVTTAEYYIKAVKQEIVAHGPLSDGVQRIDVVSEDRQEIIPAKAMAVLETVFSGDEILAACRIGKGKIMDAIAERSPRGRKGKDQKEMIEQLAAAGAIEETERKVLKLKRI